MMRIGEPAIAARHRAHVHAAANQQHPTTVRYYPLVSAAGGTRARAVCTKRPLCNAHCCAAHSARRALDCLTNPRARVLAALLALLAMSAEAYMGVSKIASSRVARAATPSMYAVTLVTPDGESVLECPDDTYVLDKAEEEGLVSEPLSQ